MGGSQTPPSLAHTRRYMTCLIGKVATPSIIVWQRDGSLGSSMKAEHSSVVVVHVVY